MMAEALGRWLREEMELPPSAAPSPAALRRLCSGPTAPVWDYVTRHVRNHRYGHLQELEAAAGPPSQQGALQAAVARLRNDLQGLGDAIADAQETAQRLETSLGEVQSRRWAELQQRAELQLLGAELRPAGLQDGHQGAPKALLPRPGQTRAELSAILASGAEPEVLVSIKALCRAREAELQRRHPHRAANHSGKAQEDPDWLEQAEAVLIGHSPGAVLWALEALANQSTSALLAGPTPLAEAPPTLRSLLQERWLAVGGVWGALPPLLADLAHLRGHLRTHLERGRGTDRAARLFLLRAGLTAFRGSLDRALQQLQPQNPPKSPNSAPKPQNPPNSAPKSPNSDPKFPSLAPTLALEQLRRRLQRGRGRVLRLQQRLRFLSAATRGCRAALRPLQEQVVGMARVGLGSAPPLLEGAWLNHRQLSLGALGEPRPPIQAMPPLQGLAREMGVSQGALLSQAAILRQELRQGALHMRRGAGPVLGVGPELALALPLQESVAELLPRLRLVSDSCRQRIRDWPRLRELVSQWWTQPAQWALVMPSGHAPFSHWLQRWRAATHALQAAGHTHPR